MNTRVDTSRWQDVYENAFIEAKFVIVTIGKQETKNNSVQTSRSETLPRRCLGKEYLHSEFAVSHWKASNLDGPSGSSSRPFVFREKRLQRGAKIAFATAI